METTLFKYNIPKVWFRPEYPATRIELYADNILLQRESEKGFPEKTEISFKDLLIIHCDLEFSVPAIVFVMKNRKMPQNFYRDPYVLLFFNEWAETVEKIFVKFQNQLNLHLLKKLENSEKYD